MIYIHLSDTNLNQTFTATLNEQVCTCTLNYSISTNEWFFSLSYINEQQIEVVQYRKVIPGQFIISRNAEYKGFNGDFYVSSSFAQGDFDYKAWSKGYRLYYMTYEERMNKKLLEAFIYESRFFSAPFTPLEIYKPGELNLHSLTSGEDEVYRGVFKKKIVNGQTSLQVQATETDPFMLGKADIMMGPISVMKDITGRLNEVRLTTKPLCFFQVILNHAYTASATGITKFKEWLKENQGQLFFLISGSPVLYTFPIFPNLLDTYLTPSRARIRQNIRFTVDLWNEVNSIAKDTKVLIVLAKEGSVERA